MRFRIEVSGEHTQPEEARADLDKQLALFVEAIRRRGWLDDSVNVHTDVRGYDYVIVDDLVEGEKDVEWGFGVPERDEVAYGKSIMEQVVDEMDADRRQVIADNIPADAESLAADTGAAVEPMGLVGLNRAMTEKVSLADRIVRAREFAGNAHLGQRELAEMFGVTRYAIKKALEEL